MRDMKLARRSRGCRPGPSDRTSPEIVDYFQDLLGEARLILDLGCGGADFVNDRSVGVDLDFEALRGSRKRLVQADLDGPLPFRNASFNGVLAKDVIEHLQHPRGLLEEVRRVTAPGGRLVLVTPRDVPRAVWADYTHVRGFTRNALRSLLRDSGWRPVRMHRMGGVPLAGRLHLVSSIPTLLAVPGIGHFFGTNWQVIAVRSE